MEKSLSNGDPTSIVMNEKRIIEREKECAENHRIAKEINERWANNHNFYNGGR